MDAIQTLKLKLSEIIGQEDSTEVTVLASYIVGELLGDYDGVYAELNEKNPAVQRIGELAADIEIANGSEEQLSVMWEELKELVGFL